MSSTNAQLAEISLGEIPLEQIVPNPDQPRKTFTPEALEEMANSIRQDGVQTPIRVVKVDSLGKAQYLAKRFREILVDYPDDMFFDSALKVVESWDGKSPMYMIIYGERRWRGSTLASKPTIPTMIDYSADEEQVSTIALIENMQRENVGFIEEAIAIQHWMVAQGLDPNDPKDRKAAAGRLGKSATYLHWRLDSLRLPGDIQKLADNGTLNPNQVCHLAWCETEEQQRKLYRLITSGKCQTHTQLEAALKALKESADTKVGEQQSLGLVVADKTQAIAITKEIESMSAKLVKMNADDAESEFVKGLKQMSVGELQYVSRVVAGMEKIIRSIHKNKVVYYEQALLASQLAHEPEEDVTEF